MTYTELTIILSGVVVGMVGIIIAGIFGMVVVKLLLDLFGQNYD